MLLLFHSPTVHPARIGMVRHIPTDKKHSFDKFGRTEVEFNHWLTNPAQVSCRNWLPLEHVTYAEALHDLGYYNQFIGKWHVGEQRDVAKENLGIVSGLT